MDDFNPLAHLQRATDARQAQAAQLLATLSGTMPPAWETPHRAIEDELQALQDEHDTEE